MTTTTKKSKYVNSLFTYAGICLTATLVYFSIEFVDKRTIEKQNSWKKISCPSLLSIARSPRDTLIIMKMEPLCNDFVIENLK